MRLIVTDGLACSVGRLVCLSVCNVTEPVRCRLGCGLKWACVLDGVQIPHVRGSFEGDDVGIFPSRRRQAPFPVVLTLGFPYVLSTSVPRPGNQLSFTFIFPNAMQPVI